MTALGGVLSQIGNNVYEHTIAYCSRVLNKHERNYSVTERECLAVIYAVKQFRVYVHGVHFKVVTKHYSLTWLQTLKEPEGRLARWAIALQAFDYDISHRPGSAHQNADCLSRLPTIAIVSSEADRLYEMILESSKWCNELLKFKAHLNGLLKEFLKKAASCTKIFLVSDYPILDRQKEQT